MPSSRTLPLVAIVVGALALTGCIVSPPDAAPQQPTPDASQPSTAPSPAPSGPSDSQEPDPTGAASGGSTITIDGAPTGSWGSSLECVVFGGTALISSSSADESGSMFGTGSDESGSWTASAFIVNDGSDSYIQRDDTVPATYDGSTFSTEFAATDISGGTVTIAISAPCG